MMRYHGKAGNVLFAASDDSKDSIQEAKKYIMENDLRDVFKVLKHEGQIIVVRSVDMQ